MADFDKHRKEKIAVSSDFADTLSSGDSLDTVQTVKVLKKSGGSWKDVSSEFGNPSGTIDQDKVDYDLAAAGSGDQAAGGYRLFIEVDTANGETLVHTPSLGVSAEADKDAP